MSNTPYNLFSGRSLERLAALSDGVFAVAMTLLVLDLHVPAPESVHGEHALQQQLVTLLPRLVPYVMSFLTLGIFWTGQQTQLNHFTESDRNLTWIHLVFLFAITLQPFSTTLLAEFITLRTALLLYWFNIVVLGAILYASLFYAQHAGLLKPDGMQMVAHFKARIVIAQALYLFGAVLCFYSTYLSIGFILAVQINYAIAPRFVGELYHLLKNRS